MQDMSVAWPPLQHLLVGKTIFAIPVSDNNIQLHTRKFALCFSFTQT